LGCAPLLLWTTSIQLINGTTSLLAVDLAFGVAIGAVIAGYAEIHRGTTNGLVAGILAGAAIAAMGYWGSRLGVPVVLLVIEDAVRGVTRLGVGRGDVNTTGVNLPIVLWGTTALLLARAGRGRGAWVSVALVAAAFITVVPAALATGSRTSVYQLLIGALLAAALNGLTFARSSAGRRTAKLAVVAGIAGAVGLMTTDIGGHATEYLSGIFRASRTQATSDRFDAFAGRGGVWGTHLGIIAEYPLTGIPSGDAWDFGEFGTAEVGRSGVFGRAHNTFIEFGSLAGVPALILCLYTVFAPLYRVRSAFMSPSEQPILIVYLLAIVGMLGLSIASWKTFWALVALVGSAARRRARVSQQGGHP
jgi:O-antigen ligase